MDKENAETYWRTAGGKLSFDNWSDGIWNSIGEDPKVGIAFVKVSRPLNHSDWAIKASFSGILQDDNRENVLKQFVFIRLINFACRWQNLPYAIINWWKKCNMSEISTVNVNLFALLLLKIYILNLASWCLVPIRFHLTICLSLDINTFHLISLCECLLNS